MIYLDLEPTQITFTIDKLSVTTVGNPFLETEINEQGEQINTGEVKQKLYYELSGPHPENEGERLTPEKKNVDVNPMIGVLLTKALTGTLSTEEKQIINSLLQSFNPTFELKKEEVVETETEE